jgi:hypothetical protein
MYPEHAAFHEAYRKAEAKTKDKAIEAIRAAFTDDWRVAMTYLERRYPHRWAKRQNLDVTSEVQPIRTIMVVRTVNAEEDEK